MPPLVDTHLVSQEDWEALSESNPIRGIRKPVRETKDQIAEDSLVNAAQKGHAVKLVYESLPEAYNKASALRKKGGGQIRAILNNNEVIIGPV